MIYVVTWWEGKVRRSVEYTDAQSAQERALALRKRSDALERVSLVPIRVVSRA